MWNKYLRENQKRKQQEWEDMRNYPLTHLALFSWMITLFSQVHTRYEHLGVLFMLPPSLVVATPLSILMLKILAWECKKRPPRPQFRRQTRIFLVIVAIINGLMLAPFLNSALDFRAPFVVRGEFEPIGHRVRFNYWGFGFSFSPSIGKYGAFWVTLNSIEKSPVDIVLGRGAFFVPWIREIRHVP